MSATTIAAPPVDTEEEAAPKRRGKKVLVIGLVLFLLAGAAAWWVLLKPNDAVADGAPVEEGAIVALEPLTTTTGTSSLHHARVGIAVVLTVDGDPAAVTERSALLQDALLQQVASTDADTLRSAEGSDALRQQLTTAAQEIWPDGAVARVVLTELLVQ